MPKQSAKQPNSPRTHTKRVGAYHEQKAAEFLSMQGLTVIATNFAVAYVGEIDIVAKQQSADGQILVFVEVRTRQTTKFGSAAQSITPAKQRKIIQTAAHFLSQYPEFADCDCRFDVIAFDGVGENQTTTWLKGAFLMTDEPL